MLRIRSVFGAAMVLVALFKYSESAVLVIGGSSQDNKLLSTIELYGCPAKTKVPDLGEPILFPSVMLTDNNTLLCGGRNGKYQGDNPDFPYQRQTCHELNAAEGKWGVHSTMVESREKGLLTRRTIEPVGEEPERKELVIIGGEHNKKIGERFSDVFFTETYTDKWEQEKSLFMSDNAYGTTCMAEYEGNIYIAGKEDTQVLNVATLEVKKFIDKGFGEIGCLDTEQCSCVIVQEDTIARLMVPGKHINLPVDDDSVWEPVPEPPRGGFLFITDGKPTVMGGQTCEGEGDDITCTLTKEVLQLSTDEESGNMVWAGVEKGLAEMRVDATPLEVPDSYCDQFKDNSAGRVSIGMAVLLSAVLALLI